MVGNVREWKILVFSMIKFVFSQYLKTRFPDILESLHRKMFLSIINQYVERSRNA